MKNPFQQSPPLDRARMIDSAAALITHIRKQIGEDGLVAALAKSTAQLSCKSRRKKSRNH
jgi:hypothetical protein